MDSIISIIALVILAPVFLLIAILIKIDSKGPIFFTQKRIGRNKKLFNIYKFRTMRSDTPKNKPTHTLKNPNKWITPIGRFLRKTSLDEIPQIFNIIKFEMSIIGPRPALWNQNDLILERDKHQINSLYPGLTGYAQINGRDEISIPEKVNFDKYYKDHISLSLDIKIFFYTIIKILKSEGVREGNQKKSGDINEKNINNRHK